MNVKSITFMTEKSMCPPIPDTSILETILRDSYGLTAVSLKALNCYEDRNYYVKIKEEHNNPHLKDKALFELMVKVINPEDSKIFAYVDGQRQIMEHLNTHGITTQSEIKNLSGNFFSQITLSRDGLDYTCKISVRGYLPGDIVASYTLTPPLLYQLGAYLADFDNALSDFECEFYDKFDCLWSLNNTLRVLEVVDVIQDPKRHKIVHEIMETFKTQVQPMQKDFRKGHIHGDPNEQNILVIPDNQNPSGLAISGIIDLQESSKTYLIYDLAAMAAYMMMHTKTDVPLIDAAGYVLAGYTAEEDLHPSERSNFHALIAARMAMSLTYGAYVHRQDPTNTYVLTTGQIGWSILTQFWLTPKEEVEQRWGEIVRTFVYKK